MTMTFAEVRTALGTARSSLARAEAERARLDTRRKEAFAASRPPDPGYIENLDRQIERANRDIGVARARIEGLTPQLPNAEERQHAVVAIDDAAAKCAAGHR